MHLQIGVAILRFRVTVVFARRTRLMRQKVFLTPLWGQNLPVTTPARGLDKLQSCQLYISRVLSFSMHYREVVLLNMYKFQSPSMFSGGMFTSTVRVG